MLQPLKIELDQREDRDGKTFYIGKSKHPTILKLKQGVDFYVYTEDTLKQIHIVSTSMKEFYDPKDYLFPENLSRTNSLHSNLGINLYKKSIQGKEFLCGSMKHDGILDFSDGITFLVFSSEEGSEELQISIPDSSKSNKEKYTPVHYLKS